MKKNEENWEWSSLFYIEQLNKAASKGKVQSYQFGNCRFDCKQSGSDRDLWDVHAKDADGNEQEFRGMTTFQTARMMSGLYGSFGSGVINK